MEVSPNGTGATMDFGGMATPKTIGSVAAAPCTYDARLSLLPGSSDFLLPGSLGMAEAAARRSSCRTHAKERLFHFDELTVDRGKRAARNFCCLRAVRASDE